MAAATYHKGHWKTEVDVEELASGKFQGLVLVLHEGGGKSGEQVVHRTVDVFDTEEGALAEAKVLAQHILGEL